MEDKTKLIGDNNESSKGQGANKVLGNRKKRKFILKNLSKSQRNMLLTGGAALGGAGLASLLASSMKFEPDSIPNPNPDAVLNQDIDNDGILNDMDDDIDGDGILNQSDSDMDGDGIENTKDDDIDGDGILNEDDPHQPDYEEDAPPVVIYTDAPFSELDLDDESFSEAFADARADIGPGGFFEWRGDVYNTYYKEEWESMSSEEQHEFMESVVDNTHFEDAHEMDIVDIIDGLDDDDLVIDGDDEIDVIEEEVVVIDDVDIDDHDDDDLVDDDLVDDSHDGDFDDDDISDIEDAFDDADSDFDDIFDA